VDIEVVVVVLLAVLLLVVHLLTRDLLEVVDAQPRLIALRQSLYNSQGNGLSELTI
jgi:hypothetical protein